MCDWEDLQAGPEHASRYFKGSSRVIERDGDIDKDITVEIFGAQGEAGDVVRHIMIVVDDRDAVDLRGSTTPASSGARSSPWPTRLSR